MRLFESILKLNDCYKAGRTIVPKGIMVHSTGCNNPWLKRYVPDDGQLGYNKYNNHWNMSGVGACVHGFIGKMADGSVATYQTLPWNWRGWHAASGNKGSANNTHISFEICEDGLTDVNYFRTVFNEAVELCAYLCKLYNFNPLTDIICHSEGHAMGIASNHGDVMHWFPKHGETMDTFRQKVYELVNKEFEWTETNVDYIGTIVVKNDVLNIRKQPTTQSTIIGKHANGDTVSICAQTDNGWYRVEYPTIGTGYISSNYVTVVPAIVEEPVVETPIVSNEQLDNTPDSWAKDAIQSAIDKGILFGDDKGNLKLHRECTRQEAIIFLYRLYNTLHK